VGRVQTFAASPPMRVTPFTTLPGKEGQPCFSPLGNQIAFVWGGEQDNNLDIYVKIIGSETPLKLTTDPAADTDPAWSPDGRYIAFLRQTPGHGGFYVVPVSGGPERKVADAFQKGQRVFGRRLDYAPTDGKFLAVSDTRSAEESFSLFLLSTETGERQKLTSPPTSASVGDCSPAFSPDGKRIAFSRSVSPVVTDIYVVSVAGGEPVRLTFDNVIADSPTWTPDGREIIFISNREGGQSLWRISATGGAPERLMGTGRIENGPLEIANSFAISPKGDRLAYPHAFSDSNIWRIDLSNPAPQSRRPMKLIAATLEDHSPQYSPDGERIVFVSARSGNRELWLCDSDGKRTVQLTNFSGPVTGTARWSPNGRLIVFDSRPKGNADIFIIDPETRQQHRVTTESSMDTLPSWSRNGQWIYFNSDRSGSYQIWKMPSAGGPATQVTKQGGFEGFESSDGKFLYYGRGQGIPGIWRVPTAGGEETLVLDHHRVGNWRYWAVVELGIYFATAENPKQPLIEFFNFRTGQISPVAMLEKPIPKYVPGLSVSPDGRSLIWAQIDQEGSDIMLMEDFR
jgi:Tol biopolymer transport system component